MENMLDQLSMIKLSMDQIQDWILITDISGVILYINPEVERLSGYSYQELIGQQPSLLKSDLVPRETYQIMWQTILKGEVYQGVITNRHKDSSLYHLASTIYPIKDEAGKIKYFVALNKDMSNDQGLKKQIYTTMNYDGLTGLLNRKSFIEHVSDAKKHCENLAVMAVTINKLGLINSRYGFVWGDKVIKEVGRRIKESLCKMSGEYLVSRPEGKVFALLIPNYIKPSKIVQIIHKIEESMKLPIQITNEPIHISLTFGMSTFSNDKIENVDADALLTRAQLALSKAKASSRVYNYEFYTHSMNKQASDLISMENEIYTAYKEAEFISYFQPFINLTTGKICGLEALMRRKKPTGEIISPIEFISFLEETGLIIEVGYNLIEKICIQIRKWVEEYGFSMPVAINLSPVQFKDEYFCEKMFEIVKKEGIPPEIITFEITESMLIEDVNRTVDILERLRLKGFSISIDDFGTGYSSLSYIQKFNINYIKIDMSFIRHIVENEADQSIVKAIIMMAEGLNLATIAEGVETLEQLEIIRKLGCNIGQGYYWNKPLSAEEITRKYIQNI